MVVDAMLTSPLHSLYNSVHRVYAPMLLKDSTWSEKLDRKMQKLLAVLDADSSTSQCTYSAKIQWVGQLS